MTHSIATRRWIRSTLPMLLATLVLSISLPAQAFEVTVSFEASLVPGTCGADCLGALGGTLTGNYRYETTTAGSGTNPRSYALIALDFTTSFAIEGAATLGTVSIANNVGSPPADAITIAGGGLTGTATTLSLTALNYQAIDEDASEFSTTDLPEGAPDFSSFETAFINMTWTDGVTTWTPVWEITSWTSGFLPGGECCSINPGYGCDEAICESAVCADDPFCCTNNWDSACVANAVGRCAVCGSGSAGGSCPVVGTGQRAALNDQMPTDPPFGGTGLGSADTARGWRFTANGPDLFIDRLGAQTAASNSVPHTVTLFDVATEAVLAQVNTSVGPGWRWVPIMPIPLIDGDDYLVTVHSTVPSWLWSGLRADIGERWFPTGPLAYVGSYLAISADPSTFPTFVIPDSQQGIADVGYAYGSCFDEDGTGGGTIVDSASGPPGQSIALRIDEPGIITDLDVSISLVGSSGTPGSETWWDDLEMTLSKNGRSYPLNANPLGNSNGVFNVVFDAEAVNSIAVTKPGGGDAIGPFRPDGDVLEPFDGDLLAGVWTLSFEETSAFTGDTVLESWSLGGRVLDEPALVHCDDPIDSGGGDFADLRGIRFHVDQDFQGIRLQMRASVAGDYTFDAEIRRSSGFVAATERIITVETPLGSIDAGRSVLIDLGRVAVSGPETFTLKFTKFTGPGSAFFGTRGAGNTPCPGVEETEGNTSATPVERSDPNRFSVIGVPEPGLAVGLLSGTFLLAGLSRRKLRPPRTS